MFKLLSILWTGMRGRLSTQQSIEQLWHATEQPIAKGLIMKNLHAMVIAVLAGASSGCSDTPTVNRAASTTDERLRGTATLECWNAANAIMDEESTIRRSSDGPLRVAQGMRAAAKRFRKLPVLNVDHEFAFLCAELSGWYDDAASTYEKAALLFKQQGNARDYFNSPDAKAEAFLRGMLGDPLGKYNEGVAADSHFRQQHQAIVTEERSKLERCNELNTEAAKLRVTLSNRYGLVFPDFH